MGKEKVYLLILSGCGETSFKLVQPFVWSWIFSPRPLNEQGTGYAKQELVPQDILDEMIRCGEETFKDGYNYHGTDDNDRALASPGTTFYSIMELMEYLKKNNLGIITEYHGCRY
jgi:hypothetical protein